MEQVENRNEYLIRRFWREVWNEGQLDVIRDYAAQDFTLHASSRLIGPRDEFTDWVRDFQNTVADLQFITHDVFAIGDKVVSRWTMQGRNNGIFDLPPDGEMVLLTGITIFRLEHGLMKEGWIELGAYDLYRQLTV